MSKEKQFEKFDLHMKSSVLAGCVEIGFFHPFDTVQKRLMKNPNPIYDTHKSFFTNANNAFNTALRDPKKGQISIYPGLAWATLYKTLQRGYKFGGQPIVESGLKKHIFGDSHKVWAAGLSGALMGAGEVVFLPLDIYKIRKQTGSPDTGVSYRALHITVLRNVVGSSCLFAVPELIKTTMFNKGEKLTDSQKTSIHAFAAGACLIASNPPDVVKTRMQANENSKSALAMTAEIAKNNPSQFFKSLTSKLITQGTKLTFFMAVKDKIEQHLIANEQEKINTLR